MILHRWAIPTLPDPAGPHLFRSHRVLYPRYSRSVAKGIDAPTRFARRGPGVVVGGPADSITMGVNCETVPARAGPWLARPCRGTDYVRSGAAPGSRQGRDRRPGG